MLGGATYLALQKEPRAGAVATLYVVCFGLMAWLASLFGQGALSVTAGVVALLAAAYGVKSVFLGTRA